MRFADDGTVPVERVARLLGVQREHRSPAVLRRADRLLGRLGVESSS